MTVPSAIRLVTYAGDDTTTVFQYGFKVFAAADLVVELDGVPLTDGVHYTVDGIGNALGGNVTMVKAPATGETLTIERTMALVQLTDLRNKGTFLPQSVEDTFDKVVMMIQSVVAGVVAVNDPNAIHDNVAGEILGVTSKGTPVEAEILLIEDSAASWVKKRATLAAIFTILSGSTFLIPPTYTDSPETRPTADATNDGKEYYVQNAGGPRRKETIYSKVGGGYGRKIIWQAYD
jgi:hypothetical protein